MSNHGNSDATHSLSHSATRRKFYKVDICLGIQLKMSLFENSSVWLCSLSDLMTIIRTLYFDNMTSTAPLSVSWTPLESVYEKATHNSSRAKDYVRTRRFSTEGRSAWVVCRRFQVTIFVSLHKRRLQT